MRGIEQVLATTKTPCRATNVDRSCGYDARKAFPIDLCAGTVEIPGATEHH